VSATKEIVRFQEANLSFADDDSAEFSCSIRRSTGSFAISKFCQTVDRSPQSSIGLMQARVNGGIFVWLIWLLICGDDL
jgi:hypothetical protein